MTQSRKKKSLVAALAVFLSLLLTAMVLFLVHLIREFLANLPPW